MYSYWWQKEPTSVCLQDNENPIPDEKFVVKAKQELYEKVRF